MQSTRNMSSSLEQKETLHTAGFQVIRQAVKVSQQLVQGVQLACQKRTASIFNHNEQHRRNDFKRRQRNLPLKAQYLQQFDASVKALVKAQVNTALIPTDPVILHSLPGCQPQAAHCDYIQDETLQALTDEQMPLAVLIALMPGTRLKVWPHSARLAFQETDALREIKAIECEEVGLEPGDMLVFRGDFVHAGSGYQQDNFRIHYYLDHPWLRREKNRTWLIADSDNTELKRIIRTRDPKSEEKLPITPPSVHASVTMFAPQKRSYDLRSLGEPVKRDDNKDATPEQATKRRK